MAKKRRAGWNCQRGAIALGFRNSDGSPREQSFSNAWNPAIERVALLSMVDHRSTMLDHAQAIRDIPCEKVAEALERLRAWDEWRERRRPMPELEFWALYDRQTGRGNGRILSRQK